ncbi:uncharacterized protein LOC142177330 [Nicotiana tabacum]|uniref:Uncharacterized protein LOC142177330 n=1 Tax=Nicotiana tabacum TaxID=4097 RepID=A0AC58TXF9_TOBAC
MKILESHRVNFATFQLEGRACRWWKSYVLGKPAESPPMTWDRFTRIFLESVIEDAAYCLYCYLFQDEGIYQGGGDVFSSLGFKSWHKKNRLDMHGSSSIHNQEKRKCEDLLKQKQSIQTSFDRQSTQTKLEYKIRLKASIEVVRLLLNQGLAFRGHREDESSLNKVKVIMDDLNGDSFAMLVDESCDVSRKEQLAIIMRYVNRCGSMVDHFIWIVHVRNTTALCLKKAIVDYLAQHSLSLSYVRGQCYDGASNMQGDLRGLKTLIQQESKSAYSIHWFAHQLQLTLVARISSRKSSEALDMGELETGRGLNQELGLARAVDTHWGSHYKSFKNFISMFGSIIDVLDTIVVDAWTLEERAKAKGYLSSCQTFEVAFMLHLMRDVLGITNELNTSLQKKEQDIANAILLVEVAKRRLQKLREEEWDSLIDKVSVFCVKYNILIPNFDDLYVNSGRSRRKVADYTILHHYRVETIMNTFQEMKTRRG